MLESELIPAREKSNRLLIMLHGLGDSIAGYRWMPEALDLPWLSYLLVNAPDQYYGGYSWYDFSGDIAPGVERSRKLLVELLEANYAQGYPAENIILGGFSQGSLMSVETGLRYPRRLAGIVGISGYVANPEKLIAQLSPVAFQQHLLLTHGTLDPLIPFTLVRGQVEALKAAGLHIEWHEFVKPHTIAGQAELEVIRDFICASYNGR
jgi:phospholipase/carboxylesterase